VGPTALKPPSKHSLLVGGILLIFVPGMNQYCNMARWKHYLDGLIGIDTRLTHVDKPHKQADS
jgi:hypothetical protein